MDRKTGRQIVKQENQSERASEEENRGETGDKEGEREWKRDSKGKERVVQFTSPASQASGVDSLVGSVWGKTHTNTQTLALTTTTLGTIDSVCVCVAQGE